jgi:formylglycine-generating enzyme required for sulfatase activity
MDLYSLHRQTADVVALEVIWCAVPSGPFLMGSAPSDPDASSDELPQHEVSLPDFAVARYPVTNAQWLMFAEEGGGKVPRYTSDPRFNAPNQPVVGVSWYEATAFAGWASSRLGYRVRLPTEAEWEKACRGQDGRLYPFGDALTPNAVCAQHSHKGPRHPGPWVVGHRPHRSSPYGIEDLVGNTYAWTSSHWGPSETALAFPYPYDRDDGREALDTDNLRVVRGGAWNFPLRNSRCAYRGKDRPGDSFDNLGIRLVTSETSRAGGATLEER